LEQILQILIGATLQGAFYTLGAFGLSLSFGVLKILNLSHGDFLTIGGFLGVMALTYLTLNPFYSFAVITIVGFLIGVLYYRLFISRLLGRSFREMLIASMIITLGTSLIMEDLTSFLWGGGPTGISFKMANLEWAGMIFPGLRVVILIGTLLLTVALHYFLSITYIGRAITASSMNRVGALVVGINTEFVAVVTFALGIALAVGTGVFYATLYSIEPFMGQTLTLKYLAVIIVGGMGSLPGAMLGGFIVAVSESYTSYFAGPQWSPMVAFIVLIAALLLRPQGLLGRGE
jgi:branched-chain amino acid transport system permease protein